MIGSFIYMICSNIVQTINSSFVYFCRTERLGRNGIEEIKTHQFFRNIDWTWETLRQGRAQAPTVIVW